MKKTIFGIMFAIMFGMALGSCNCGGVNNTTDTDSIAVDTAVVDSIEVVDSLAADTVALDSTIIAE